MLRRLYLSPVLGLGNVRLGDQLGGRGSGEDVWLGAETAGIKNF